MENGPLKMYKIPQIVQHDFPVELPTCMYPMKNIHGDERRNGNVIKTAHHVFNENRNLDISDQNHQDIPGMTELMKKQEKILQQLENLKNQMLNIRQQLNVTSTVQECKPKVPISNKLDLILNASPDYPPYSLNLLSRLLKDKVKFVVSTYIHSSVKSTEQINNFVIPIFTAQNDVSVINLQLIWKDVGIHAELVTSEGSHIFGEVNMLRYIARKLPFINYEKLNDFEIDSTLDTCHCMLSACTKTERSMLLRLINYKFNEKQQITIADLALYSVMKQIAKNELSANLVKLLNHLEKL